MRKDRPVGLSSGDVGKATLFVTMNRDLDSHVWIKQRSFKDGSNSEPEGAHARQSTSWLLLSGITQACAVCSPSELGSFGIARCHENRRWMRFAFPTLRKTGQAVPLAQGEIAGLTSQVSQLTI